MGASGSTRQKEWELGQPGTALSGSSYGGWAQGGSKGGGLFARFGGRGLLLPLLDRASHAKEIEVTIRKQSLEARALWVLEGKHKGRRHAMGVRGGRVDPRRAKGDREGSIGRVEGIKGPVTLIWGCGPRRGGSSGRDAIDGDPGPFDIRAGVGEGRGGREVEVGSVTALLGPGSNEGSRGASPEC
jgi:hypothetical protein